jgi:hypothetical protein
MEINNMPSPITSEEIENRVLNALKLLSEADYYLLKNDLNECSINHMLHTICRANSKNGI